MGVIEEWQGGAHCQITATPQCPRRATPGPVWKQCCCRAQHPSASGYSPQSPCPNVHKVANKSTTRIRSTKTLEEKAVGRWKPLPCSSVRAQVWITGCVWGDAFLCCWGHVCADSPPWKSKESRGSWHHTQVYDFSWQWYVSSALYLPSLYCWKGENHIYQIFHNSKQSDFKATTVLLSLFPYLLVHWPRSRL